ncbi:hypothetical protein, partial [Kitasatospora sp. NPDC050463]|uniref:hypothetical protein n=1 Tax=Kitasatospora sp. NPDC050463 TaxID=3155786 RepID=UPI0033DA6447
MALLAAGEGTACPTNQAQSHRRCSINTAIRRAARGVLPVAVSASVLAAGLTACGTVEQLTAAQKVSKAFGKLGDSKAAGLTISLDASPEQIVAFGDATGDKIEQKSAEALSGLSISVAMAADKPLKDLDSFKNAQGAGTGKDVTPDKSLRVSYLLSDKKGTALLEYRQVDAKAYLRVDAKGLVKLVGEDPAEVDAVSKDLSAELNPVKDVLAGKWVSFDLQELADRAEKPAAAKSPAPSGRPTLDPDTAKQLTDSLKDVFSRTVTFDDKGKKDGVEHLLVSAPARRLTDELLKALKPLSTKFPEQFDKLPTRAPADLPDTAIGVDLYLKGGRFSSATFDLAQLEPKAGPGHAVPVKLAFSESAPAVQAPADAVRITDKDIRNAVLSLASATAGEDDAAPGGSGEPLAPGKPLTDAQVKELTGLGIPEEQVRLFNGLGMDYEEIKSFARDPVVAAPVQIPAASFRVIAPAMIEANESSLGR